MKTLKKSAVYGLAIAGGLIGTTSGFITGLVLMENLTKTKKGSK